MDYALIARPRGKHLTIQTEPSDIQRAIVSSHTINHLSLSVPCSVPVRNVVRVIPGTVVSATKRGCTLRQHRTNTNSMVLTEKGKFPSTIKQSLIVLGDPNTPSHLNQILLIRYWRSASDFGPFQAPGIPALLASRRSVSIP